MQSCFVSMDEIQALGKKIAEQEFPEGMMLRGYNQGAQQ